MDIRKSLVVVDKIDEWEIEHIIPDGCPLSVVYQAAGNFMDKSVEWINEVASKRKEQQDVVEEENSDGSEEV